MKERLKIFKHNCGRLLSRHSMTQNATFCISEKKERDSYPYVLFLSHLVNKMPASACILAMHLNGGAFNGLI